MNLNFSWLEGNRPILVPPDNKEEIQSVSKGLLKISLVHFKYITFTQTNRIDRYIECVLEHYPEDYATDVPGNPRPNTRLKQHIDEILNWVCDKQGNGYIVTWHQE